jgi:hypothetical protein
MADRKHNPELMADLLGYHLGLVDEETRARIESEFSAEELAAARSAMRTVLSPLDAEPPSRPPQDLVGRIMARIDTVNTALPMKKPLPRMTPATERGGAGRSPIRLRELISLAAAIALFLGVFMPGYRTARLASQKAMCANNLASVAEGYGSYAEMNSGQMPYVPGPMPPDGSWMRTVNSGVPAVNNSRNVWLLVNGRYVPPSAMICAGRDGDQPLNTGSLEGLSGFPNPRNNSYATNFVTKPQRKQDLDTNDAVMGDMNPLAETPAPLIDARGLPPNSRSHGGAAGGQNVLFGNFSVRFVRNPNVGVDNDDIYRLIGVQEYTGRERPVLRSDAFLVP